MKIELIQAAPEYRLSLNKNEAEELIRALKCSTYSICYEVTSRLKVLGVNCS